MKKVTRRLIIYTILGTLGLLFLFEIILQIYNYNYSRIKTETAVFTTIVESIETDGYVVRDEQVVRTDKSGVFAYNAPDGSRVSSGSVVAYVYPTQEQAETHQKIKKLSGEINRLKELQAESNATSASNQNLLMKEIDDKNLKLVRAVEDCDFEAVNSLRQQIMYLMTKYNLVIGKDDGVDARISELSSQLATLTSSASSAPATVGSPCTGYFISSIDGYEDVFTSTSILEMSPEQFEKTAGSVTLSDGDKAGVVGKVATGFTWYYACLLDKKQTDVIEERAKANKPIYIVLNACSNEELPVTVSTINRQEDGKALVVFNCRIMSEILANVRNESATIIIGKYKGLGISKAAIRSLDFEVPEVDSRGYTGFIENDENGTPVFVRKNENGEPKAVESYVDPYKVVAEKDSKGNTVFVEKNVQAVYVILANEMYSKRIKIIYDNGSNDSTVICEVMDGTAAETSRYIKQYDNVVVEGRNLYDGKIVN